MQGAHTICTTQTLDKCVRSVLKLDTWWSLHVSARGVYCYFMDVLCISCMEYRVHMYGRSRIGIVLRRCVDVDVNCKLMHVIYNY